MISFTPTQLGTEREFVVEFKGVTKRGGANAGLSDVSLDVHRGEIVSLFGPSGSGKTTILRIAAGLDRVDTGEVFLDDRLADSGATSGFIAPIDRHVGLVLPSYAVWSHMTVAANVAYPLTVRRQKGTHVRERVSGILEQVGLGGQEQRPASQLDTREQLLLAIARGLAISPSVILLDDPISGLDRSIRDQVVGDLRLLQRKLDVAMLIATRNEVEAISISDRIVVLAEGRIEQIGAPSDLYTNPLTKPILNRLGRSVSFPAKVGSSTEGMADVHLFTSDGPLMECVNVHTDSLVQGQPCDVTVRPEAAQVCAMDDLPGNDEPNVLRGIISVLLFFGDRYEAAIELPVGGVVRFDLPLSGGWREGQPIALRLPKESLHVWPGPAAPVLDAAADPETSIDTQITDDESPVVAEEVAEDARSMAG